MRCSHRDNAGRRSKLFEAVLLLEVRHEVRYAIARRRLMAPNHHVMAWLAAQLARDHHIVTVVMGDF